MKKLLLPLIILLSGVPMLAQVSEIKENVETDQSTSIDDSEASISKNVDSGLIFGIFDFIGTSLGEAQRDALSNREDYPERIMFEIGGSYGADFNYGGQYWQTNARANWGIVGSDFTYSELTDATGKLQTIDWLIAILRVPIKHFVLEYGMGSIMLPGLDQTYFKTSAGFDWFLPDARMHIIGAYQWSSKTSLETRFKRNAYLRVQLDVFQKGKIHVSPRISYQYQSYFSQTEVSLVNAGLAFAVY